MKKNAIVIAAAIALVLLAVPTIAFANGMQQASCALGGSGFLSGHVARHVAAADEAGRVNAGIVVAQGERVERSDAGASNACAGRGGCSGFVDQDGNGVCDVCANGQNACPGYVDDNADGACDRSVGDAHRGCNGYVDADNDGVCDNVDGYGSGNRGEGVRGNGCGAGHSGHGHGCMR